MLVLGGTNFVGPNNVGRALAGDRADMVPVPRELLDRHGLTPWVDIATTFRMTIPNPASTE